MTPNQQLIVNIVGIFVAAMIGTLVGGYLDVAPFPLTP